MNHICLQQSDAKSGVFANNPGVTASCPECGITPNGINHSLSREGVNSILNTVKAHSKTSRILRLIDLGVRREQSIDALNEAEILEMTLIQEIRKANGEFQEVMNQRVEQPEYGFAGE